MYPLDPPPAVLDDPKSREIARIWGAHGRQYVTLDPRLWDDPAAWGLMLVDLARHVANAYMQLQGFDRQETLERIKIGFDMEWSSPTDEVVGEI
jgi:hypothetical protein